MGDLEKKVRDALPIGSCDCGECVGGILALISSEVTAATRPLEEALRKCNGAPEAAYGLVHNGDDPGVARMLDAQESARRALGEKL